MGRLDDIEDNIDNAGCDQCEGAADLLAVVHAVVAVYSTQGLQGAIRQIRYSGRGQPSATYRDACEVLADKLAVLK